VDPALAEAGRRQLEIVARTAIANPFGMGQAVLGLDRLARGSTDVVVVGAREEAEALVAAAYRVYLPSRTIAWIDPGDARSVAVAKALAEGKAGKAGEAVAYVCRGRTCSAPVSDPAALEALLRA